MIRLTPFPCRSDEGISDSSLTAVSRSSMPLHTSAIGALSRALV